jgi:competence protein ComEA
MKTQSLLSLVTILVLVGVAILGGITLINTRPAPVEIVINPPPPTVTPAPTATPAPIVVYITGAVNNPSTISLKAGSRVEDAINQAGGFAENADKQAVNLADILRDGVQVHVPSRTDNTQQTTTLATPMGPQVVYINRATIEELMNLPDIGEVTAGRIIAYREANGNFTSFDDLDNVQGIGPAILAKLQGLISFEP